MAQRLKIKVCKICEIPLSRLNSYYPADSHLLCKKHLAPIQRKGLKKYLKTEKGKAARARADKNRYARHKIKILARLKARYAVKDGTLLKPKKCEVCTEIKPLQGHHEDYSKPLEVIWLCSSCHADADRVLEAKS